MAPGVSRVLCFAFHSLSFFRLLVRWHFPRFDFDLKGCMSDFARTFSQLRTDRTNATVWMLASALVVLIVWFCWAMFLEVSLYEVSSEARVELDGATYPVDSPFLGRIVATSLRVGQPVQRGELLVELDAMPQQLQLSEARVQEQGLEPQLSRLRSQIEAEQGARGEDGQSARLSAREAQDRVNEAEMSARFAEQDLDRVRKLALQHVVSIHDLDKAESEAGRLRAAVAALQVAASRVPQDHASRDREGEVRIARLQGEIATLEAQRATLQAETSRLTYEIERRRIRAPVDGLIGEAANLRTGAVVTEGEQLGSIVPSGHLLVVAQYPPSAAFGRIRAGEPAVLRLEGFPWPEFGTVSATVERVAQEVRNGKVRVELTLSDKSSFRGSLQHGMPGTLEVTVERVSPWGLTLRTAGQWLTRPL
jgi:multidrug resistance efflux pump